MTDLSQQITDHLKQCDRIDDSEILLELAREQIDRLNHEMEATKEAARAREAILREALQGVMVGGNHLAAHLQGFIPAGSDHRDVLDHLGAGVSYDIWCCWNAIMHARAALNGEAGE
ncbi:hypothetical protein N6L27_03575 [Leisingera sp. SS27]|uniref:hypothetical protein n=1 Tax=Leisingera sp. SS27 TaxID=2979462 RepID=UPI00232EA84A|nr:hypothetical protein [Leisingera sp. SS27]MDC0657070.1 hypothetical protein [Leisingera sp. SS27]